jgi:hypothetical protein
VEEVQVAGVAAVAILAVAGLQVIGNGGDLVNCER